MKRGQKLLWFVFIGLLVSGIGLYWSLPATPDDFPHPLNGDFRKWHGLFTFLSLISMGQVWAEHIRKQIKQWREHPDGALHLALWVSLIISGYLLYFPAESLSEYLNMGSLHWYSGLTLVLLLPFHILLHKRKVAKQRQNMATRRRLDTLNESAE